MGTVPGSPATPILVAAGLLGLVFVTAFASVWIRTRSWRCRCGSSFSTWTEREEHRAIAHDDT